MKTTIVVWIIISFFNINLQAGKTVITGSFPGAEGREIRLMFIGDNLTFRWEEKYSTIIDSTANFSFSFSPEGPVNIALRIDHSNSSFYVEPGMEYNIVFDPFDFNAPQRQNVYWLQEDFKFTVTATNGTDLLNPGIGLLKELTDDFLESRSKLIRVSHNAALKAFHLKTDSAFADVNHPFFSRYYEYYFASLYHTLGVKRPMQIFDDYFRGKPVEYDNSNYMYLLYRVFFSYIQGGNSEVTMFDLKEGVNVKKSYKFLHEVLGRDTAFEDLQLRELILIMELSKLYGNRDFPRENVTEILLQLKEYSTSEVHKKIATNIIRDNTSLQVGYPAPFPDFENLTGNNNNPDSHDGKFIVLMFITTWCQSCIGDLGPFSAMAAEFAEDVHFAAVIVDRDAEKGRSFVSANNMAIDLFYFEHDYRLLEKFRVTEVPSYMVIDPEGKLAAFPFPSPGAGAADFLKDLVAGRR